jgi:hypothetical protein
MEKIKDIFIIIVTFNNQTNVKQCLESLQKVNRSGMNLKILVIDNASKEFNPDQLAKQFPEICLIKNAVNLGFGKANNIGLRLAYTNHSDYALLLNPDTKVNIDPNFLTKLTQTLDQDKSIAIVGPCLKHQVNGITFYDYGGQLELDLVKARHINRETYINDSTNVRDFVSGACMLLRVKVLPELGMFDEKYFLYLEDVDLAVKHRYFGYKIVNNCSSLVEHDGGRSSTDVTKIYYSWQSAMRMTDKWLNAKQKPISYVYNSLFYPYLLSTWLLKRLKKRLVRL